MASAFTRAGKLRSCTLHADGCFAPAADVGAAAPCRTPDRTDTSGWSPGRADRTAGVATVWAGITIPADLTSPRISPDGTALVFVSNQGNELTVRDLATGRSPVLLHDRTGELGQPLWSADGKRLVYHYGNSRLSEIRIVDIDGQNRGTILVTQRELVAIGLLDWDGR